MGAKRDYYEVLGVSKTSPSSELKTQYRKLALKFHPDRNKSAESGEHFKEISEAYAILSDPEKRKVYDQHGHAGVDGRYTNEDIFQGAGGDFSDIFGKSGGFDSIFESIFSRSGGSGSRQRRGSDILYETSVTLEDVLHGKKMEINLSKEILCEICHGSGCKPGTKRNTCSTCNGQGQVRKGRTMGYASFVTVETCSACRGQGSMIQSPCSECRGNGRKKGSKKISFDIPSGVDAGDYTVTEEGNETPGGTNGDLIVRIRVQPHQKFKRDDMDIFYDHDISMIDAALGSEIIIPTLDGTEKIKVESGSQPNTIIKLKGKGVPRMNSKSRGDQYVRIIVNIPKKLSKHQKSLLDEFQKSNE